MELRFLYVGSSDTERDVAAWLHVPGAHLRWRFRHFGADVAAIDLGAGPLVLLADHRPSGTVLPMFAVEDLDASVANLAAAGWTSESGPMGTPEGPAVLLRDPSGTAIALLRVDRPDVMDAAFASEDNTHAVRDRAMRSTSSSSPRSSSGEPAHVHVQDEPDGKEAGDGR